jgi:fucose permease
MWGANAAAPLNTAHLGYGIGAVFVNLLVRPFLTKKVLSVNVPVNQVVSSTLSSVDAIKATSNIIIPYTITAALCVLIAAGHTFFYIQELRSQKEKLEIQRVRKKNLE